MLGFRSAAVGIVALALSGCAQIDAWTNSGADELPQVGSLAILPIERAEAAEADLPEGAERAVTAALYGVLSESPRWRLIPDLAVADALPGLSPLDDLGVRAYKLAKAVGADSVLFGTVTRFDERQGSEYGATRPAAVSITLKLLSVSRRKVVWKEEFNETQQSLSQNLFNFWQFWRGGPKWFSAREFTRLGVERMIEDLEANTLP